MKTPIYETETMTIMKEGSTVLKTFDKIRGYKKRYSTENAALQTFKGIPGVPVLIDFNDNGYYLRMSYLSCCTPNHLLPDELDKIKEIITTSLQRAQRVPPCRSGIY